MRIETDTVLSLVLCPGEKREPGGDSTDSPDEGDANKFVWNPPVAGQLMLSLTTAS